MTCPERQGQMSAYLDEELDLTSALELERHLEGCAACAGQLAAQRALRGAIAAAASDLRFRPSAGQSRRLHAAWRRDAAPLAPTSPAASAPGRPGTAGQFWPRRHWSQGRGWRRRWGLQAAALLAVALASWALGRSWPAAQPPVSEEVVASHVRSLLAGHFQDVASSDRHVVKPWFSGKLDYAPAVVDLATAGFPLRGGRLDYVAHRPVAALVYQAGNHLINLFTWPASPASETGMPLGASPQASTSRGFHLLSWSQGGMTYYAVSDVAASRLRQFGAVLGERLGHLDPH